MSGRDYLSMGGDKAGLILGVVVVIVLMLVFLPQLINVARAVRTSAVSALSGKPPKEVSDYLIPDEDMSVGSSQSRERMEVTNALGMGISDGAPTKESSELMQIMGYGDDANWNDVLKTTELDPATFANHQDFVKDVRRFSSGANFTSVTDDNTNSAFTNFVGLRRPQQVDIGASARQQPDIDQSVLKRNKPLRWGYSAGDATYLTAEQEPVPAGQYQWDNVYEGNVQNAENFVNW